LIALKSSVGIVPERDVGSKVLLYVFDFEFHYNWKVNNAALQFL